MASDAFPDLKALGRYTLERTLGTGAMGVVYEGTDPRLGRRVAIKTILKSQLDEDTAKDYSTRFVREAQAVARLNHPNIVQVYDFGEEGDVAYLVMEFIKGKELKAFFDAHERFDLKEAVRIMGELCEALDFAHNAGIIHRDIKPANVMIDSQGRTKLTDFGVARVQDSNKTSVERTQAGAVVGTPAYMSPEQITGGKIDKRTDVFSAGIVLYQFLTGEKPFTGSGAWTIAKKIMQEQPILPSSLNNAITPLFDSVVNKALSKSPETRYQSARELGVALRRALEGKPEENDDKTVVHMAPEIAFAVPKPQEASDDTQATRSGPQDLELEFWRSIKDGNDAADFELYVQQFPSGIYAALAKRKIAKLRGVDDSSVRAKEQEKKEQEEAARREAEVKQKLEAEKARLEAEMERREAEYRKREAEAEEKRAAREAELRQRMAEIESRPADKRPLLKYAGLAAAFVLVMAGGGIFLNRMMHERDAAIEAAERANEARQRAEELGRQAEDANRLASQALNRLQAAVQAEKNARAAGDAAKIKAMADAREKAEKEANRQQALANAAVKAAEDAKQKAPPAAPVPKPTVPGMQSTAPQKPPPSTSIETPKPPIADTGSPKQPDPQAVTPPIVLAQNLEAEGKGKEAVRAYIAAANSGNCEAARRLGQLYGKGLKDVPHDYQESLSWYNKAEKLGCKVTRATGRG